MFRSLELKKSALEKIRSDRAALLKSDVEGSVKSLPPGEWVLLRDVDKKRVFLGFINPLVEDRLPAIHVLKRLANPPDERIVSDYIEEALANCVRRRKCFGGYESGARIVFGDADGLPGLIVDSYRELALIQINTAGLDRWRSLVKEQLEMLLAKPCFFLDNPTQRSREMLPHYREELPFEHIEILENEFLYSVPSKNLQKNGWYYDHRENRSKFESALKRWTGEKTKGLDLFCYGGAWGLHALRGGVTTMTFVDQAPLSEMLDRHLASNGYTGRGTFIRNDVFDWLDEEIKATSKYDVVISDPPAFAKSPKDKIAAIEGYKKLHKKVIKVLAPEALVAFASCTHYVDLQEFIQTVEIAGRQEGRTLQILELGMQGWDHPVRTLEDKANYIKYVLVKVE